jgi:hypothetical protein
MARNLLLMDSHERMKVVADHMNLEILEIIALLFPEPSRAREGSVQSVLALVRDEQGLMEIKSLRPDVALIKRARVTGRVNCGTPILDPITREVMGYEIDPIMLPAA